MGARARKLNNRMALWLPMASVPHLICALAPFLDFAIFLWWGWLHSQSLLPHDFDLCCDFCESMPHFLRLSNNLQKSASPLYVSTRLHRQRWAQFLSSM